MPSFHNKAVAGSLHRILLWTVFFSSLFGQFQRLELPFARAIYIHELALILLILATGIAYGRMFKQALSRTLLVWLAVFDGWVLLSLMVWGNTQPAAILSGFLYLARLHIYMGAGISLLVLRKAQVVTASALRSALLLWTVGVGTLGLFQYFLMPDTRWLVYLGWDDHYYRLLSTLLDPGFTGIILAVGLLVLLVTIASQWHTLSSHRRLAAVVAGAILTSSLLLTYSRASYLAFGIGCIVSWALTRRKTHILVLILFLGCIPFLPRVASEGTRLERTASVSSRVDSVTGALTRFTPRSLLLGRGWYSYRSDEQLYGERDGTIVPNHASAPDNSYIFLLSSLGIVGVGIVLVGVVKLFEVIKLREEYVPAVAAIGMHAVFTNTFLYVFVLLLLAVLTAYTGRSARQLSRLKQHPANES